MPCNCTVQPNPTVTSSCTDCISAPYLYVLCSEGLESGDTDTIDLNEEIEDFDQYTFEIVSFGADFDSVSEADGVLEFTLYDPLPDRHEALIKYRISEPGTIFSSLGIISICVNNPDDEGDIEVPT